MRWHNLVMQKSENKSAPGKAEDQASTIVEYLQKEVWPQLGSDALGNKTKQEREHILGIGPGGYPE